MFKRIVNTDVIIPASFSSDAGNCIRGLLTRNVAKRLGSDGAKQIMKSEFFAAIDFDALLKKEIRPPVKPEVANEYDTRYVPKFFLDAKAQDSIDTTAPSKPGENLHPKFDAFTFAGETHID